MGPLSQVMEAFRAGAVTNAEIARTTGLALPTVEAAVAHLRQTGLLHPEALNACAGGCGGCASRGACSSGPVALVLGRR